jgi:hypothetical protein
MLDARILTDLEFFYSLNAKLMGVVIMAAFLPRSAEKVPLLRSPIERLVML